MPVSKSWLAEDLFRLNRACSFHCGRTCQLVNVTQRCQVQEPEGVVGCVLIQAHYSASMAATHGSLSLKKSIRSGLSKGEGGRERVVVQMFLLVIGCFLLKH